MVPHVRLTTFDHETQEPMTTDDDIDIQIRCDAQAPYVI